MEETGKKQEQNTAERFWSFPPHVQRGGRPASPPTGLLCVVPLSPTWGNSESPSVQNNVK